MAFMIYVGVFVGIALIALDSMGIGIYSQVKGKEAITKKQKLIHKVLLGIEAALILAMILLPQVTKSNLLPEGSVYLAITQNQKEQVMDVTNLDTKLDLSTYQVGDITFSISNENAKNVDFELIW